MIRHPREPGKAHPIMPGCLNVPVSRRFDLPTLRPDLLEPPITLPVIATPYKRRMLRRHPRYAELAHTMITRAASPLPIEDLESILTRQVITLLPASSRDLRETAVTGPPLLADAVVSIRRDIAIGLLRVGGAQPPDHAGDDHIPRGH